MRDWSTMSKKSVTTLTPYITNYNELEQKCTQLQEKWEEVQKLAHEILDMKLPIGVRTGCEQTLD